MRSGGIYRHDPQPTQGRRFVPIPAQGDQPPRRNPALVGMVALLACWPAAQQPQQRRTQIASLLEVAAVEYVPPPRQQLFFAEAEWHAAQRREGIAPLTLIYGDEPPRRTEATRYAILETWRPPPPEPRQLPRNIAPLTLSYGDQPPPRSIVVSQTIEAWKFIEAPRKLPARYVPEPIITADDPPPQRRQYQTWSEEFYPRQRPVTLSPAINQQVRTPGTIVGETISGTLTDWVTPSNAGASDDIYTTTTCPAGSGFDSEKVVLTDCAFTLPSSAIIRGYQVDVEGKVSDLDGLAQFSEVILYLDGNPIGTNKASGTRFRLDETTLRFGGPTDTWSTSLAQWQVNSASFGFRIQTAVGVAGGDITVSIDHGFLMIWFEDPGRVPPPSAVVRAAIVDAWRLDPALSQQLARKIAPLTLTYGDQPPRQSLSQTILDSWRQIPAPIQQPSRIAPLTLAYGDEPPAVGLDIAWLPPVLEPRQQPRTIAALLAIPGDQPPRWAPTGQRASIVASWQTTPDPQQRGPRYVPEPAVVNIPPPRSTALLQSIIQVSWIPPPSEPRQLPRTIAPLTLAYGDQPAPWSPNALRSTIVQTWRALPDREYRPTQFVPIEAAATVDQPPPKTNSLLALLEAWRPIDFRLERTRQTVVSSESPPGPPAPTDPASVGTKLSVYVAGQKQSNVYVAGSKDADTYTSGAKHLQGEA
jgi:hypothetical protein